MIERMAREFSSRITCDIVTFTYPNQIDKHASFRKKIVDRVLPRTINGRRLSDVISAFEPDLIYSDSPFYAGQYHAASFLRRKKPLILHLRGNWWQEYWDWVQSASWKTRAVSIQHLYLQTIGTQMASKITPICKWLEDVVKHHTLNKRTEVVYQGVDPTQFYPQEGFEFQRPAVAIIQNHTVYRKVVGLLSLRLVIARLPDVHFYIAEGEAVNQSFLPLIKEHFSGLPNAHFIPGITTTEKVRQMLTASDCYVLASGLDCCPTTVLEASLMRKPVIASRTGGVPEIILEDETGWTIENQDVEDWVNKIKLTVTDSGLNKTLGDKGRGWVKEKFGWSTVARQVEDILVAEAR
jgi:glycosyltransferase involved in cell wall biosynthesis